MASPHQLPPSDAALSTHEEVLSIVALAAALLFSNGQTTKRMIVTAERLGSAFGVPIRVLPRWGELTIEIDGTPVSEIVAATPLGVDMGKVLAVTTVIDQICDGTLPCDAARPALMAAGHPPPVPTPRFALMAAVGAASMGVIFGALDVASLLLIASSAGIGALVRRCLAKLGGNPFVQPLCAATIAGAIAAAVGRLHLPEAQPLVALCPCMVLVPGPHILNGAIDLARARIARA